jgi:beta-phosphoglucomutase-like phosphatase (HAD superfamily)
VASSSTRGWFERWLGKHAILHRFDALCGRDDVARVKPAPDLFLLAAERLGVRPETCVVFEDSPNGIRAARSAGMRCVAVPNALTRQLTLPDPDLVLTSLAERPLHEILRAVGFDARP